MSKQHPEKSFKDEVMHALNNSKNPSENKQSSKGIQSDSNDEQQQANREEDFSSDTVTGSRRTKATAKKSADNKKNRITETEKTPMVTDTKQKRKKQRQKEDRIVNKIVTIVVLAFIVVGSILGFSVYRYVSTSLQPLDANNDTKIAVEIPNGSSNKQIGEILEKDKVIKSGIIFNYYTKFNNLTGFQAGNYEFSPSMTLEEIGLALQTGGTGAVTSDAKLTIPEGYDVEQIGDALEESTSITKEEFLALMENQEFFDKMYQAYPELLEGAAQAENVRYRLEGYLFPATYDYYKGTSLEDVVTQMIDKSNSVLSKYYEQINQKNLTVHEVLTLASLVEKEGVKEEDRKNIAQVFFNRLAIGMPLQSDISILYALGEHKEVVTVEDTQVDSPYNLYLNTGYGPGPFDNPSEQSINAVLNPTPNNYYYFVADLTTGEVYFAETFEQHNELVNKYVNNTSE